MPRLTKEQQRLMVAEALRNLSPDVLEDSELVDLLSIEPEGLSYWPHGEVLAGLLQMAVRRVIERTQALPSYEFHCSILLYVTSGHSIAAWAKEHGLTREHVSRSIWKEATQLVMRELLSQKRLKVAG